VASRFHSRGQVKSRIEGLLAFVSLTDRRALKTDTLSGGMQLRHCPRAGETAIAAVGEM